LAGASWGIFKGPRVAESKQYIQFMLRKDNSIQFFHESGGGWLPPVKYVFNDSQFWTVSPYKTFAGIYKCAISAGASGAEPGVDFGTWPWAGDVFGASLVITELQKVIAENKDPKKAVADAAAGMEEIVKRYKK
jgi:ABC-type glycerol-3-phosphate transport system substrate-binding protein